ncbi:hypothetical protein RKD48_001575 [Streptomyces ambofaciens]
MVTTRDGGLSYVVFTPQLSMVTGKPAGTAVVAFASRPLRSDEPQPVADSTDERATAAAVARRNPRVRAGVNNWDT